MKLNKFEKQDEWPEWVGKEIIKHSKKPFKNGEQVNVVLGLETNPHSGKPAFKVSDDALVDCFQCKLFFSPKKRIVEEEIFRKYYNGIIVGVSLKDLPDNLEPNDILHIREEEAFYSENNSWDDHTIVTVLRPRLETDEEFEKRIKEAEELMSDLRERRYKTYLKLKEEFENEEDV